MRCPYCREDSDKVVDSRAAVDGDVIRRRRECLACGRRFTTYERCEAIPLTAVKRSGMAEPFDRAKLARGIGQSVAGRAVAAEAVERMADEIAEWAERQGPQIPSDAIGVAVLERLRPLDPVSYLDFERVAPHSADLTAPLRLDCALTYRLPGSISVEHAPTKRVDRELTTEEWQSILAKAWAAGIPELHATS